MKVRFVMTDRDVMINHDVDELVFIITHGMNAENKITDKAKQDLFLYFRMVPDKYKAEVFTRVLKALDALDVPYNKSEFNF